MGLKNKIDDYKVVKTNRALDRKSILELHKNITEVNDRFELRSREVIEKVDALVTKNSFEAVTDDINLRVSDLETSTHSEIVNKLLAHSQEILSVVNAHFKEYNDSTIAKILERLSVCEEDKNSISKQLLDIETIIRSADERYFEIRNTISPLINDSAKVEQLSAQFTDVLKDLAKLRDDCLRLKELEKTYREIANSLIEEKIATKELAQKTAETASLLILEAFNKELTQMDGNSGSTIGEAMLSILKNQGIISQKDSPAFSEATYKRKLEKNEKFHQSYRVLKDCVLAGVVPMVVGPAGSGKSHAIEQLSADLGLSFYMANRIQNTFELTGFVNAAGNYVTTQFYEAFTKGGLFFFDEVDASSPEALVTINAAIAQGHMAFPGHPLSIKMHSDFKVVVAGNTYGNGATMQYTGRNKLDAATLDRFMIIDWDYDKELEKNIITDQDLLEVCWVMREASKKNSEVIISTRGIESLEKMLSQNIKGSNIAPEVLIKKKFFATTKPDTIAMIIGETLSNVSKKNKYYKVLGMI